MAIDGWTLAIVALVVWMLVLIRADASLFDREMRHKQRQRERHEPRF